VLTSLYHTEVMEGVVLGSILTGAVCLHRCTTLKGSDGYPERIWNKRTGEINKTTAAYWKENYDLKHILERDITSLYGSLT
jgi:hypothetical protein